MKHPKVGSLLDDLIAGVQAGEISAEEAAQEAPLHRGDSIGVAIHLSGNVESVVRFLESNGASNISARDDYIEAYVPVLLLAETSQQPGVVRVRPIQPPVGSQSGSGIPGNGPAVHGSAAWNQAGYTGSGVKVGVIDSGFDGFDGLMGTEVPASVQVRCYPSLGEYSPDLEKCRGGSHGTEVAESVMDIAPNVTLYIADPQSHGDLSDTVDWMISEGVSVINHSRTWQFDGLGDGTSPYAFSPLNTVDRAVTAGIVWVNAAGNSAEITWFQRGPFSTSTISNIYHKDGSIYDQDVTVINFSGSNFRNRFHLWGPLLLRWDDTWGGASSNLDLLLLWEESDLINFRNRDPGLWEESDIIAIGSRNRQSGEDWHDPFEAVLAHRSFDVVIAHRGGDQPGWIQLLAWGGREMTFRTTETGSITNPAESGNPGMLTVGAAHWSNVFSIRSYSSRGPTPDGRIKPDVVGADCGETAGGDGPFCGTSQASPHVAGMAAMVRQRFPVYSPAQVVSYLKENAEERISSPDPNNTWGHGFIVLPPNPPQLFGAPSIDSVTEGVNSLSMLWSAPAGDGGSPITTYDLRYIETSADETVDPNWTVVDDVWTSGADALSHELTGLRAGTQYDIQVRALNSTGDGPWSTTVTGTPTIAETPCSTGGAVPDPNNNPALVADCDTLLAVRDTLAGNGTLNWSASTPITRWDGIEVSGTPQRITVLYLVRQRLTGIIPPELGSLTGLDQLTLIENQLTGPIPFELGNLANLRGLHLFSNRLTGSIPTELGRLTNLQGLGLYDNRLTGSIPSQLADVTNLGALHVETNQLTGPIPPELGRLANLQWLTLHDNQLTGEVPDELGRLTKLEQLWLGGNQFTGCVSAELRSIRVIDRTHRLKEIGIPYCDELLSGLSIDPATLSPQFDAYSTDYTVAARSSRITFSPTNRHNATFEYLDGDDNVLADLDNSQAGHQMDLPAGRVTTIRVRIIAPENRFGWHTYTFHVTGPETLGASAIDQIAPGTNSLTVSWTPPPADGGSSITAYDLRRIETSADETVDANWTVVENVWTSGSGALSYELTGLAGGTPYDVQVRAVSSAGDGPWSATAASTPSPADCATGGAVPDGANNPGLVSDCEILLAMRDALRGTGTLDWSTSIPITEWRGVTVGGTPTRVTALYRPYSGLNGVIPAELGNLAKLEELTLTGNQLSGRIPAGLGNLANLRDLSLSSNNLSGEIPTAMGNLSKLAALLLESNQLTGEIPAELGNLSSLVWLHLDHNQLTGEVPAELGSLSQLERLYLGNNQLTGCVPASLRNVAQNDLENLGLPDCGLGTLPGAPTRLEATSGGQTQINLSWTAPADDGGSAVTGYRIEVSEDGAGWNDLVGDTRSTATGYSHTGLTPGVTRHYRVSAMNSAGVGPPSNIANAATGAAPAPDLVVDTPTVSESAPAAGARFTLSATVRNQGNGDSAFTTLRYYRSSDSTITSGDTEVGTDSVFWLDPSESGDESVSLDAPSTPGTYYYGACVDALSDESDTTNNCSPAVTVTVGAAPAPDLVVDAPAVSESAPAAGARFTLSATVRNQGNGRSDSTTLRYYQSSDPTITTRDTEIDTDYVSRLDASESGDESVSLDAPATPGTYYYGACVDALSDESDTTNNCSPAVTVTVGAAPATDLVVETPAVSESAPAAEARFTLSATVRNQGNGRSDSTTLRYYQSTDSTITTSDTEVDTDYVSRLDPSESGDESVSLDAPATPGTYYYGACVDAVSDESDTTNNCSPAVTVTVGAAPAPDLVVDAPAVSENAPAAGARFTLSATVRNQGNGRSDSTTLRYYQSSDPTITTRDTEIDTDYVSRLDAAESGDESISLTAPSTPGTYHYGACVDSLSDETDTVNNCSAAVTVTVGAALAPDLVVDTPTVSESAPAAGASFTLNATVRNQGNGASAFTTLRYYQSTDSTITTGDAEVGSDSVSSLDAVESGDESISLTAPSSAGTYYYGACVDSVSSETDTTNNCSVAVTVTVGAASAPDLVVDTPTVSESAPAAGASFTLNATVRNRGNGASAFTTLRYYQSTDSTITTGDAEVGSDSVSSLDAVESGDESISLTAPSSAGTYYYGACVGAVADESDTTNNCSAAVAVTVGAASAPDLVVDTPTVSESAPAAGASFTLNATVRNQGNGASAFTTLRYYQSSDSTITTGDTQVGSDSVSSLDAVESGDESISLTAPSSAGTYYYGACVGAVADESDTTNNCSAAVAVTVGAAHAPDLVVDTPTVSESAPAAGARFTLSATVRNQGSGPADSTTLRYYQSTDSTITIGDTEVGTDSVFGLAASWSGDESVSLTAPSAPGTYYYGACVEAVSDESDATNNCSAAVTVTVGAAPAPDLVVDAPTVSESAPVAGARFTLSATVRNQGNGQSDSTTLRYYQSSDSTITTGDTEVDTDFVSGLGASGSGDESVSLTAPSSSGTHYYGACVDTVSDESDTTNNCSSAVTVTVGAAPAPDLVVDAPTVSESAPAAGASFRLSATVRNQGNDSAGITTLHYYRSTDSAITAADMQVGTDDVVFHLAASDTSDKWTDLTAPSTPGAYYYGACVDAVSDESDTTNNCSSAVTVTVGAAPAPDLVVDTPAVSDNAPTAGASFTLSATVRNQGSGSADSTTLRYYRSTDSTITTGDTEVGTDFVSGMGASGSGDESVSLTAPSTPGAYYYGACVDAPSDESDTTNNCSVAVTVTVGAAPDLVVDTPTVSKSSPVASTHFTLNVTVSNRGNADAAFAFLTYYRSEDSTIATDDRSIGTERLEDGLDASKSSVHSMMPRADSTRGATYYYGACITSVSGESDTSNNCSSAVRVTVTAVDLVVNAFSVSDSSPTVLDSLTLNATVRNRGGEAAGPRILRWYRSINQDTIHTLTNFIFWSEVDGLAASQSSDESITIVLRTAGTYYYSACVDSTPAELDSANNCSATVKVTVGAGPPPGPPPDLTVDTPTVSDSSPAAGTPFTLSATVRNQGSGSADSTTLRYYRSTDSTITTGDTEVGTDFVSGMGASGSGDESVSLTAPDTPGTYYYGACVEAVPDESDTTNNCSSAVTVTVSSGNTYGVGDFLPGVPTSGLFIPAVVSGASLSSSGGNTTITFTNGGYIQLQDGTRFTCQSTGGCGVHNGEVTQGTIVGESTSVLTSDLIVDPPKVSDNAPTAGASFTLNATVRNQGNGSSESTTLRYYRSADSTITTSDSEVGTDSVSGLSASGSSDESISLTAPSDQGTYYYGACADSVSDEADTTNNCSAAVTATVGAAPAPDLTVSMFTAENSSPAGSYFTANATVNNQGNGSSTSTTLSYHRSTDATITTSDPMVSTGGTPGYRSVGGLSPFGSEAKSSRLQAPFTPGTYYYGACVDAVTGESDTTNNCSPAATVTVGAAAAPDLVVDTPTISESAWAAGASFTLNTMVRNQGNGSSDSTTLRYYLSSDSTITTGDTEVGTDSVSGLGASQSGNEFVSLTAPSTSGTYYYGACADSVSHESDTTNNCSDSLQVTIEPPEPPPAPDLVVDTLTVSESILTAGDSFTLSFTVRNQGDRSSSGPITLRYYHSNDAEFDSDDVEVAAETSRWGIDVDGERSFTSDGITAHVLFAPSSDGLFEYPYVSNGLDYYFVCVDQDEGESDTTNNCSTGVSVNAQELTVTARCIVGYILTPSDECYHSVPGRFGVIYGEVDAFNSGLGFIYYDFGHLETITRSISSGPGSVRLTTVHIINWADSNWLVKSLLTSHGNERIIELRFWKDS